MEISHNAQDTLATQEALKTAVDNRDYPQFKSSYLQFLKRFPSFREAYSETPTEVIPKNVIFGEDGFFLKQTNDEQARTLLANGRAASNVMKRIPLEDRLQFLKILEDKISHYREEIKTTITADTGKPIDLSEGEMNKGKEWFDYAHAQAEKQIGNKHASKLTNRAKPLGVVQVIGAYNYPYALAIGGIVGALTTGNGIVVASPLKAPNWVFPFVEAAREAAQEFAAKAKAEGKEYADDLAKVAGNIVQYNVGRNDVLTTTADGVHFVGSDFVGQTIHRSRGLKPTILEMGGSNVVTVMKSVLEKTTPELVAGLIYSGFGPATGQRCTAPRFLCIQEGAESVSNELKAKCDQGPGVDEIGNPFKKDILMGPLVDQGAHQKMEEAIALAHKLGAKVHGKLKVGHNIVPLADAPKSYWVNPIAIDWSGVALTPENIKSMNECFKHEIFGPLIHIVHPVKDIEGAIATTQILDNHHLAAAIFTADANDVKRFEDEVNVTSLAVNGPPKDQSPHGSHGHPGLPTIGGANHFGLYSDRKTVVRYG